MKKQDHSKRGLGSRIKKSSFRNNDICNELYLSKEGMRYKEKHSNNSLVKSALKIAKAIESEANTGAEMEVFSEPDIVCRSINSQQIVDEQIIRIENNISHKKRNDPNLKKNLITFNEEDDSVDTEDRSLL